MTPSPSRRRLFLIIWTFALIAELAAVPVLNRRTADRAAADAAAAARPPAGSGGSRFGFQLVESAQALGVDFVHQAPTFDARLDHIMPQIASVGAAVAVADFDRDGWQDFYVTNSGEGSLNHLYRNKGNGTFEDVAAALGVADVNRRETGVSMGAVWGDYDNDGFEDLLLYKYGRPELFHNLQGHGFEAVGARAGLPAWANVNSALWLDFDRDGRLDLFIAGYWSEDINLWQLTSTRIMPESFEYAENGGRKYLLRNKGDGTFEDVTKAAGLTSRRWTLAATAADLFGSGFPDLFIANDYGISHLYKNEGGKRFVDVGVQSGVSKTPKSGMNAAVGDVFNDGRLAIYKTNISEPGVLVQANDLWVPKREAAKRETTKRETTKREAGERDGEPTAGEYENLASSLGIDLGGWSWGAQFGDLNNDGALDIYLVNGYVSAGERTSYWYDFSEIAVGHSAIIADAKNWPAMRGRSLSGYQHKRVWINDGLGRFTEVAQVVGAADVYDGRAVALADLSNRGVLDVIVANQRGPLLIYKNTVQPGRHWLDVELDGHASNRSAIGAQVELHWGGRVQLQEVSGGTGFSAQNQRRLHYGLGTAAAVDRLVIRWPSGTRQTIEHPAVDTLLHVQEPQ